MFLTRNVSVLQENFLSNGNLLISEDSLRNMIENRHLVREKADL